MRAKDLVRLLYLFHTLFSLQEQSRGVLTHPSILLLVSGSFDHCHHISISPFVMHIHLVWRSRSTSSRPVPISSWTYFNVRWAHSPISCRSIFAPNLRSSLHWLNSTGSPEPSFKRVRLGVPQTFLNKAPNTFTLELPGGFELRGEEWVTDTFTSTSACWCLLEVAPSIQFVTTSLSLQEKSRSAHSESSRIPLRHGFYYFSVAQGVKPDTADAGYSWQDTEPKEVRYVQIDRWDWSYWIWQ